MESFSVIVTAHNMESVILRTLRSVEGAFALMRQQAAQQGKLEGELIVVDDGSADNTWPTVSAFASGKPCYKLVRHPKPTSPSCARNAGVQASTGSLLFFIDGDDFYYPDHIALCLQAMESAEFGFVKTMVHIADPIHPDWIKPINSSLVINFCVRRRNHDAISGFPDFLLCRRDKGQLHPVTDIFYKFEDMYYNLLMTGLFPGLSINRETVEYLRYPGHSFDLQYEKFQFPYGVYSKPLPEGDN